MPPNEPPFISDAGPRSDVRPEHGNGEATEHEGPSTEPLPQARQADVQGEPSEGARPWPQCGNSATLTALFDTPLVCVLPLHHERDGDGWHTDGDTTRWRITTEPADG